MKKVLYFILSILSASEIVAAIYIFRLQPISSKATFEAYEEKVYDYIPINFNYDSFQLRTGMISKNNIVNAKIVTDIYYVEDIYVSSSYKNTIFNKGDKLNDHTFSYTSRIMEVETNRIKCENLDSSRAVFNTSSMIKIKNKSEFDFKLKAGNYSFEVTDYNVSYDEKGYFSFTVFFENQGLLTSGMSAKISYVEKIETEIDKIYVPLDYLQYIDDNVYVLKYKFIDFTNMYKPILVNVISNDNEYALIEGDLSDGNIIIKAS